MEPWPKRHASTPNYVSIVDVSHEEPKFVYQMTKETQLIDQDTTITIDSNIDEIVT